MGNNCDSYFNASVCQFLRVHYFFICFRQLVFLLDLSCLFLLFGVHCHLELMADVIDITFVVAGYCSVCFLVLNFAAVCNQFPQNPLYNLESCFIKADQEKL